MWAARWYVLALLSGLIAKWVIEWLVNDTDSAHPRLLAPPAPASSNDDQNLWMALGEGACRVPRDLSVHQVVDLQWDQRMKPGLSHQTGAI